MTTESTFDTSPQDGLPVRLSIGRKRSLPGLAEHLGVVRSAIHTPLKELETSGLVWTRSAHVIGGGSRRRSVIHLTPEGRERAEALAAGGSPPEATRRALGPMPDPIHLHGRDAVVDSLVGQLLAGSTLQLSDRALAGMAGFDTRRP